MMKIGADIAEIRPSKVYRYMRNPPQGHQFHSEAAPSTAVASKAETRNEKFSSAVANLLQNILAQRQATTHVTLLVFQGSRWSLTDEETELAARQIENSASLRIVEKIA